MKTVTIEASVAERQRWLAVLANAPREALANHAGQLLAGLAFETLREAETGLLMLQGRIGGDGDRFNLGEASVTRCVVRHRGLDGTPTVGVGYRLGRDPERVRWMARFDALLQHRLHRADLLHALVAPLAQVIDARRADLAARAQATRVKFFELQPGTAP